MIRVLPTIEEACHKSSISVGEGQLVPPRHVLPPCEDQSAHMGGLEGHLVPPGQVLPPCENQSAHMGELEGHLVSHGQVLPHL